MTPSLDPAAPSPAPVPGFGAMLLLILATGVITGASSMIIVSLPAIARALDASLVQSNGVVDAFTLSLAVVILAAGALTDRLGLRRALLISLALMVPVQALGAVADSVWVLIGSRLAGGLLGAVLYSAVLGHVVALWPGPARAKAIAQWGMGLGAVAMVNPPLAGWIEAQAGWRAVVAVTPGVALITLAAAWRWLPVAPPVPRRPIDLAGCALAGVAVAGLLVGVNLLPTDHPGIGAALIALGLLFGTGFVRHSRGRDDALIPLTGPQVGAVLLAAGVTFMSAALLFAFNQTMEHYAQDALGLSTLAGGFLFAVGGFAAALGSRITGPLIVHWPMRTLLIGSTTLTAAALLLAALTWTRNASPVWVVAAILALALAFGISNTAATHAMTVHAAPGREGSMSALTGLARYLGGSLGLAALGAVLAGGYRDSFVAAGVDVPAGVSVQLAHSYALAQHWAASHPASADSILAAARAAIVAGADAALWVSAVAAAAWVLMLWRFYPRTPIPAAGVSSPSSTSHR
ncbi:MAG: MFS transporter [Burkholderiaceae bacterium]